MRDRRDSKITFRERGIKSYIANSTTYVNATKVRDYETGCEIEEEKGRETRSAVTTLSQTPHIISAYRYLLSPRHWIVNAAVDGSFKAAHAV